MLALNAEELTARRLDELWDFAECLEREWSP